MMAAREPISFGCHRALRATDAGDAGDHGDINCRRFGPFFGAEERDLCRTATGKVHHNARCIVADHQRMLAEARTGRMQHGVLCFLRKAGCSMRGEGAILALSG